MNKIAKWFLPAFILLAGFSSKAQAQVNAASCSNADVQNAINSASAGQTVNVPAGSCSWTSVNLAKAIVLKGAGTGLTNITVNSNPSFTVNKQASGIVRVQGFTFIANSNNNLPHPIVIQGPWPSGQAVIFQNNAFNVSVGTMFDVFVAGGVIFSHNSFNGGWDNFFATVKDLSNTNSWTTADSMGTHDSNGLMNIYIEDNNFTGGSNGVFDCDDNCRIVVRHNTFSNSGGLNSHGADSSPYGMRHFEVYSNSFLFPDTSCSSGQTSLSNINQYIWIRGGSGVIFNNTMTHLSSTCWGTKSEIRLSLRGAEDDRPQGSCSQVAYPVPHQLGRNNNGSSDFTDPIYVWGNTGTAIAASGGWAWGNPCGFDWNTFFKWGRDGMNASLALPASLSTSGGSVSALGGTPKPGYTAYAYPHPLISGQTSASSPVAPTGLTATVQ